MQHGRRSLGLRRRGRYSAPLLALLALLVNQALLPTLHFPTAGFPIDAVGDAAASHHHPGPAPSSDGDASVGSQVCHFCRFVAVALPPPSSVVAEVLSASDDPVWVAADTSVRPREHFRTGRFARAPPLPA